MWLLIRLEAGSLLYAHTGLPPVMEYIGGRNLSAYLSSPRRSDPAHPTLPGGNNGVLVIYQFPARKSIAVPPRGPPWGCGHLDACSAKAAMGLPLPSHRCHLYCDDCLGHLREDCRSCSVLYCVPRLYTVAVSYTHLTLPTKRIV